MSEIWKATKNNSVVDWWCSNACDIFYLRQCTKTSTVAPFDSKKLRHYLEFTWSELQNNVVSCRICAGNKEVYIINCWESCLQVHPKALGATLIISHWLHMKQGSLVGKLVTLSEVISTWVTAYGWRWSIFFAGSSLQGAVWKLHVAFNECTIKKVVKCKAICFLRPRRAAFGAKVAVNKVQVV